MKIYKILFIAVSLFFIPIVSQASTLYMDPAESQYGPGDSFPIDIKINTDGICINAVELNLEFSKGYLQVVDFIFGDSIINLWVEKPDVAEVDDINQSGQIYMAGGTPGGYCGKIPGDPGESNTIARIIFRVPSLFVSDSKAEAAEIKFLTVSKTFINDGFGTLDEVVLNNARVKILNQSSGTSPDWREQIKSDKIPPEPFVIEMQSNPNIYNGRYYIDFFTVDKQSGVDRYEVLELRPNEKIGDRPARRLLDYFFRFKREPIRWERGEIPYLLIDQDLKSVISVRAIDKAGNERLVEFVPPKSEQEKARAALNKHYASLVFIVLGIILLIAAFFTIFVILKKKKSSFDISDNKKEQNKNYEEEKFD